MKRTVVIAIGTPAVAALFLLVGGAPAASAGEQHHHKATCQVARKCRPDPLPKPVGGWPCAKTHSCGTKHHYPICKPPVVVHPRPPIVHPKPKPHTPTSHVVVVPKAPPVASRVPQLPRTGGTPLPLAFAGGAFVLAGAGLRKLGKAAA